MIFLCKIERATINFLAKNEDLYEKLKNGVRISVNAYGLDNEDDREAVEKIDKAQHPSLILEQLRPLLIKTDKEYFLNNYCPAEHDPLIFSAEEYKKYLKVLTCIDCYEDKDALEAAKAAIEPINFELLVEELAKKISSTVGEGQNINYNNKLEVHQPSMPLFFFNEYTVLTDCCTDHLQEHIEKGWRVVCVCPQPDQRRPDYVLGRQEIEQSLAGETDSKGRQ